MLQENRRAVVERGAIVAETVDNAVQGSKDQRTGLHKQVETEVNGTPLGAIVILLPVAFAGVDRTSFIVSANAYVSMGGSHALKQVLRECRCVKHIRQIA